MSLHFKKVHHGYIVYRPGTDRHSHFKSKQAAKNFISLMKRGLKPKSPYFLESAKRLLTDDEFERLRVKKNQTYHNVNKGVRYG